MENPYSQIDFFGHLPSLRMILSFNWYEILCYNNWTSESLTRDLKIVLARRVDLPVLLVIEKIINPIYLFILSDGMGAILMNGKVVNTIQSDEPNNPIYIS